MPDARDIPIIVALAVALVLVAMFFSRATHEILNQPAGAGEGAPRWEKVDIDGGDDLYRVCTDGRWIYTNDNDQGGAYGFSASLTYAGKC